MSRDLCLYVYLQSVVGEPYVDRELVIGLFVEASSMTHVYEVGTTYVEFLAQLYGILDSLMGGVWTFPSERVDYQCVNSAQCVDSLLGSRTHVGDVGDVVDAIAKYGQVAVHYAQGSDSKSF